MDRETVQKLMRLKRHEQPPEGYFEDFLKEFHLRQRQELLKRSSLSIFMERLQTYLSDPRSQGWAYAPVLAVFLVAFYCIIGFTDDAPLPSVPTLAQTHFQDMPALTPASALDVDPFRVATPIREARSLGIMIGDGKTLLNFPARIEMDEAHSATQWFGSNWH